MRMTNITGIVLAGGICKSFDYQNKALLKIGNKSIIETIIGSLSKVTDDIFLITNSPDEFKHLGLCMFKDILPGSGSLGGIYTGLKVSNTHHNLIVACDMPFIQPYLFTILIDHSNGHDVIIPITQDGYQPTCAIYSKNCIGPIETQIKSENLKILDFFPYVKVNKINFDASSVHPNIFFNINTIKDYSKAISMASNGGDS